jgi:hypothetical protein
MIGMKQRVPRAFGDNAGVWPVRLMTTKSPKDVHKKPDAEQAIPGHDIVVLNLVWTESDMHAKRLKDRMIARTRRRCGTAGSTPMIRLTYGTD